MSAARWCGRCGQLRTGLAAMRGNHHAPGRAGDPWAVDDHRTGKASHGLETYDRRRFEAATPHDQRSMAAGQPGHCEVQPRRVLPAALRAAKEVCRSHPRVGCGTVLFAAGPPRVRSFRRYAIGAQTKFLAADFLAGCFFAASAEVFFAVFGGVFLGISWTSASSPRDVVEAETEDWIGEVEGRARARPGARSPPTSPGQPGWRRGEAPPARSEPRAAYGRGPWHPHHASGPMNPRGGTAAWP